MTMFPAHHNLSKQNQYSGYGVGCGGGRSCLESGGGGGYQEYCSVSDQACLGSDLMAEDDSRTESNNNNNNEAGSSSKDEEKDDQGWLQLSMGVRTTGASRSSHHEHQSKLDQMAASHIGSHLIELDLLPPSGGSSLQIKPLNLAPAPSPPTIFNVPDFQAPFPTATPLFMQQQGASSSSTTAFPYHHDQETNYLAFRPALAAPSFSSLVGPPGSYFARPFHVHGGHSGAGVRMDVNRASLDFRVVEPPRRPQSGVWFMLQASPNQYLPQIPRSYIRIKDGRMTIRLLMKYLVNKLRLDNESEAEDEGIRENNLSPSLDDNGEVEITCRGQPLLPFLTLQHVRDNVWRNNSTSQRNDVVSSLNLLLLSSTAAATASTTNHLMVLQYGRVT